MQQPELARPQLYARRFGRRRRSIRKTGYVCDLSQLKKIVEREIVDVVDHKNFNLDVPFMKGVIPTSENIVDRVLENSCPRVTPGKLTKLVLWETENNYVEYTGK